MSDKNCFIAQGEYGRKFIESIHREIERIKTEKHKIEKYKYINKWGIEDVSYIDVSCRDLFVEPLEFLFKGASNKEPAMMYLAAEFCYNLYIRQGLFGSLWYSYSYELRNDLWKLIRSDFDCLDMFKKCDWDFEDIEDYNLCDMFVEAAECGSPHAQWWCAYCMEHGINGFIEDPEDSRKMIENINTPIETLDFNELYFLKEEFSELNFIHTCADTSGFPEDYNPGSNALSRRTGVFAAFVASLGLSHLFEVE